MKLGYMPPRLKTKTKTNVNLVSIKFLMENYHCATQCNAVILLQFFFSSSVVFLLVINYELPKQVMRGRLKEKWLFSRLFWFLCLLNHVWEGEVSNRWNEPPYHLLRHQREPPCAEPTMFCSTQPNTVGQNLQ